MAEYRRDTIGIVAEPQWIFFTVVVAGLLLHRVRPLPVLPMIVSIPLGVILAVAGIVLARAAVIAFQRSNTSIQPRDLPAAIVTSGPYRFSRNPIYLGMALLSAGIGLIASANWVLVMLPVALGIVQKDVIEREERSLTGRFPDNYPAYMARVRRWL